MTRSSLALSLVLLGLLASACAPAAATVGTTQPATVVVTRIVTATPEGTATGVGTAAATPTAVPTALDATGTVEPTAGLASPTAGPSVTAGGELGWARSRPLPMGQAMSSGDLSVRVVQVTRPANVAVVGDRISGGLEPGREYAMVVVEATCEKAADQMCRLSVASDFKLVGSDGIVRGPAPWFGASGDMLAQVQFFGGSTVRREAVFDVAQGDSDLVLVFQPMLDMTVPPAYLALQ